MAEDMMGNAPIDGLADAELDDLFSAFDGMSASDDLKAKTLAAIAALPAAGAAVGAAGAATQPAASAHAATPAAAQPASAPNVTAKAAGKAAKSVARSPLQTLGIAAAAAACVSAAVIGGMSLTVNAGDVMQPSQAQSAASSADGQASTSSDAPSASADSSTSTSASPSTSSSASDDVQQNAGNGEGKSEGSAPAGSAEENTEDPAQSSGVQTIDSQVDIAYVAPSNDVQQGAESSASNEGESSSDQPAVKSGDWKGPTGEEDGNPDIQPDRNDSDIWAVVDEPPSPDSLSMPRLPADFDLNAALSSSSSGGSAEWGAWKPDNTNPSNGGAGEWGTWKPGDWRDWGSWGTWGTWGQDKQNSSSSKKA